MIACDDVRKVIEAFVESYDPGGKRTKWRTPVVAFADAADPEFAELKSIIGPDYCLPGELLPNARSLVAYFLPHDTITMESNVGGRQRSLEWDTAYFDTNNLIQLLNEKLISFLKENGFRAATAPPTIVVEEGEPYPVTSNWSQRHIARIAGLGTFGLNNMLISKSGCCGRYGTVVTDAPFTASPKLKTEYCLYKRDRSCTVCASRCYNGCYVEENGVIKCDTQRCNDFLWHGTTPLEGSPGDGSTCGKCLCGLPCSTAAPL